MTWTISPALVLVVLLTNRPAWAAGISSSQSDLCLDPSVIQQAAKFDGIAKGQNPDKFAKSLTSSNNFLNFCRGAKLSNGAQVETVSCNPTPIGFIPSVANMPSVRIIHPSSNVVIPANADFNVTVRVRKMDLGYFTSPTTTYQLAPQHLNSKGLIKGHLHIVAQKVIGKGAFLTEKVAFFKGIADKTVKGQVSTIVKGGLPAGFYRISTITSAMNHQPVILGIAQRGLVDDAVYVRVGSAGGSSSTTPKGNSLKAVGNSSEEEQKKGKKNHKKACRAKKRKA